MSIIVIGVGQTMRGDDAIGVLAVQSWCSNYPQSANHPKVQVEIAELPGLDLLELLSGAENALIVDAVESGAQPGMIYLLDEAEISAFDNGSGSAHGWGVGETIQLGRNLNRDDLPDKIRFIGIGARQFDMGNKPSPEVILQLPQIVELIEGQVISFLGEAH
jgi:hydrogenase maturation protease